MMRAVLWMWALLPGAVVAQELDDELTDAAFAAWRERLLPREDELAWRKIPWLRELRQGLQAGAEIGKPVLLWAMNGHPLGCT